MDEATLRTVWQQRQQAPTWVSLAGPMGSLVGKTLAKRVKQLGAIAAVWDEIIPTDFHDHTALESLQRGTLTVRVDSASRRFQLPKLARLMPRSAQNALWVWPLAACSSTNRCHVSRLRRTRCALPPKVFSSLIVVRSSLVKVLSKVASGYAGRKNGAE